jgi:hypothetical protein
MRSDGFHTPSIPLEASHRGNPDLLVPNHRDAAPVRNTK